MAAKKKRAYKPGDIDPASGRMFETCPACGGGGKSTRGTACLCCQGAGAVAAQVATEPVDGSAATALVPRTTTALARPSDFIDPVQFARDLTAKVGASADFSFRRSVRENTGGIRTEATEHAGKVDEWPAFVREVYAYLYDPEELTPLKPSDISAFAKAAMHALQMQAAFPMLREAASAHRVIAAESAAKLSAVVAKALGLDKLKDDDIESADPRELEGRADAIKELLAELGATEEQIEAAVAEAEKQATAAATQRGALLANLAQAMRGSMIGGLVQAVANEATKKAQAVSLLRGFGLTGGSEDGDDGIDQELLDCLAGNQQLLKVLEECGRLKESAAAKGLAEAAAGNCDVVGVEPGRDPRKLIPSELARLDDPLLGDDVMRRLLDGNALTWEMQNTEHRDRGDVILIVDRSGSMSGSTIVWARGLAAAILVNARRQGRRVVLTMFGSDVRTETVMKPGDLKKALKLLGLPASGGTNTPLALRHSSNPFPDMLRDPDVLLVTDGGFPDDANLKKALKLYPKHTRFLGLMLNSGWYGAHEWLDEKWSVRAQGDPHSSPEAVEILKTVGAKSSNRKVQHGEAKEPDQVFDANDLPF